ncbi:hypothetical protein Fcan01_16260 [Folsomia candida]|uniref:Uncharacterized protein n=1 Tax=Folsomia candida TaxID=158441 RepID=A0A226DTB1_FOLCA|nr:hypothetical protein Fcan01_16260 [Folsomia candida]
MLFSIHIHFGPTGPQYYSPRFWAHLPCCSQTISRLTYNDPTPRPQSSSNPPPHPSSPPHPTSVTTFRHLDSYDSYPTPCIGSSLPKYAPLRQYFPHKQPPFNFFESKGHLPLTISWPHYFLAFHLLWKFPISLLLLQRFQQNRPYSIILMLTDEEELLLVSELRRLFKMGHHLTHLHLKQIFYVFATTVKPPRSNKFCHATSTSSPTKALSTPAAGTIKLCLPSPPQPKILRRHMGHQLSPPRPPLPQIYPRILRPVPEFYLIPPLVVTPHVPSDIDHAIDSYTLPAWRNNFLILQRPPPLQFTTDISFLYTEDLLIHALPNLPLLAAQLPATLSLSLPSI